MFHVKHWVRYHRPRLTGRRRPYFDAAAGDQFVKVGAAAGAAVRLTGDRQAEQLREMGDAFEGCKPHANDVLLETIRHYCLVVQAHVRGDASRAQVDETEAEFYVACREALGIEKMFHVKHRGT